ncbi:SDR family oxidoreductase [Salinisphaera sp.]|uniref:SDR family NAD(P)-dependent oxidoreductase n=1 Tax=Salinisphaera sp. TaxID=1914330 RepID=UPI000C47919A|nr:SDR family oxidoreductase [Salinisphaera sp.]MAS10244.1 oxidoreductase [Salinisphaera sp.]|tara:strand:+ start:121 stop:891 length:771 start_codon:yes stop_codon:yes gene_type:complete
MSNDRPVALITGSSSGIGAASARLLAERGYNVVINYSRSAEAAEGVARECEALGAETIVQQANVAEDADCRALAKAAEDKWGRIDALVNNAGTTRFCAHEDLDGLSAQDFQDLYAVNTIGAYQMVRAVAPSMQAAGRGSVVNVASIAGVMGFGSSIAYAASKGALITMTKSLARALGPAIRVNAVCPGFVRGSWLAEGLGEKRYNAMIERLEANTPLAKVCTPEDVAESIAWFAAGAGITTGETLLLDGGMHLGRM